MWSVFNPCQDDHVRLATMTLHQHLQIIPRPTHARPSPQYDLSLIDISLKDVMVEDYRVGLDLTQIFPANVLTLFLYVVILNRCRVVPALPLLPFPH